MLPKVEIKRKKTKIYKISKFIPTVIEKYIKTKSKENFIISETVKKILGEEILLVISIVKYESDILTIKVKNLTWKNELKFREEEIKNLINSQNNYHLQVKKIIFK